MFWALKKSGKNSIPVSEHWILNFPPTDMLWAYSLLVKGDVACHKEQLLLLKTVKRMLYLGDILLHYILI